MRKKGRECQSASFSFYDLTGVGDCYQFLIIIIIINITNSIKAVAVGKEWAEKAETHNILEFKDLTAT